MISYLCIPIPYDEKDTFFFLVLVLEALVGHHRTLQLQLLQHYWVRAYTWITVILNGLPWKQAEIILFCFETAPKYCISDSFFDSEGYSISSKGVLPTVVDIMVI